VHPVEIWLGAYKPRMLRLTGRLADGWLPSQGYAEPDALPALNAVIDEAPVAAGRGPQAVRRMYNVSGRFGTGGGFLRGTAEVWTEQLAELSLTAGVSTYILGTDDPDVLRRFAGEVAPAVRELVDTERARRAGDGSRRMPSGAPVTAPVTADRRPLEVRPSPDSPRLGSQVPWREDDRPVAAKPDDATYTAAEQAVPQHLLDVHDHLRGELAQLRDVVGQVRRGALSTGAARSVLNTMAMRQNNWTLGAYCETYCRLVTGHHTLEDHSIFVHLRRADPDLGPVIDRLEQEHHVIADVLEQVDEALVGLVGTDGYGHAGEGALDEIARALDLLTDTLLSHLASGVRERVHPLARHGVG
jgi:hypothetical protein